MRVALLVAMLCVLPGCLHSSPDPIVSFARWEVDEADWWQYELTIENETHQVRLVYRGELDGGHFAIDDKALGRWLARMEFPLLGGTFVEGVRTGTFWYETLPERTAEPHRQVWVAWPPGTQHSTEGVERLRMQEGATRTEARGHDQATYRFEGRVTGHADFDATIGWWTLAEFSTPMPMTWRLVDHGRLHDREAWVVEQRNTMHQGHYGFATYDLDANGANLFWYDYAVQCAAGPGAAYVRILETTLDATWVEHRDACPDDVRHAAYVQTGPIEYAQVDAFATPGGDGRDALAELTITMLAEWT